MSIVFGSEDAGAGGEEGGTADVSGLTVMGSRGAEDDEAGAETEEDAAAAATVARADNRVWCLFGGGVVSAFSAQSGLALSLPRLREEAMTAERRFPRSVFSPGASCTS